MSALLLQDTGIDATVLVYLLLVANCLSIIYLLDSLMVIYFILTILTIDFYTAYIF